VALDTLSTTNNALVAAIQPSAEPTPEE